MNARRSPVVRRRRLALELRRLREKAGHTIDEVAEHLECSSSKVSRLENAQVAARIQDVREMLDLYGVSGDDRDALIALVREARQKAWWHPYGDVMTEGMEAYYGLEDEATAIRTYETHLVPGLLQTAEYARALLGAPEGVPTEVIERRLELRMARQGLFAVGEVPTVDSILDESVLRRPVGGPAVMRSQLLRLVEASSWPQIALRVMPFSAGCYAALATSFVVFEFAEPADPKVVYVEDLTRNATIDDPAEVAVYAQAFDQLRSLALTAEESVELLRRAADDLT